MRHAARCYTFGGSAASESVRQSVQGALPGLLVQAVDSAALSNEKVAEILGEQTLEACRLGSALAKKREVDLLMRLGGTTQISRAIREVGAKRGSGFVLVVIGEEADILALESKEAAGWTRLPRSELSRDDLRRIERGALLNAERA